MGLWRGVTPRPSEEGSSLLNHYMLGLRTKWPFLAYSPRKHGEHGALPTSLSQQCCWTLVPVTFTVSPDPVAWTEATVRNTEVPPGARSNGAVGACD